MSNRSSQGVGRGSHQEKRDAGYRSVLRGGVESHSLFGSSLFHDQRVFLVFVIPVVPCYHLSHTDGRHLQYLVGSRHSEGSDRSDHPVHASLLNVLFPPVHPSEST